MPAREVSTQVAPAQDEDRCPLPIAFVLAGTIHIETMLDALLDREDELPPLVVWPHLLRNLARDFEDYGALMIAHARAGSLEFALAAAANDLPPYRHWPVLLSALAALLAQGYIEEDREAALRPIPPAIPPPPERLLRRRGGQGGEAPSRATVTVFRGDTVGDVLDRAEAVFSGLRAMFADLDPETFDIHPAADLP